MASTPENQLHRRSIAATCGLAACTVYVAAVDPAESGVLPPCPLHRMTGLWCPGCGMTRATHHLLNGDVITALRFNALVPIVLAAIGVGWVLWLLRAIGHPPARAVRVPAWAVATALVAVVAFAVVRNLPGVAGLRG